ncbi:MAG: LysE family transporter [Chitinophagales bacterium]|nr:LysE family transporter [Chitinophagales bacterium]
MNEPLFPVFSFLLGAGMSFIGTLPPGVISITVMDTAARKTLRDGLIVAGAAAFVEFFQAVAAVLFGSMLSKNIYISTIIQYSAAPVFLLFGLFILLKKDTPKIEHQKTGTASNITKGMLVSASNLIVIPFWILWSSYFASNGWIDYSVTTVILFSLGITLGTFFALSLYAKLGLTIANKSEKLAYWGRKIIGIIFLLFGFYQLLKIIF